MKKPNRSRTYLIATALVTLIIASPPAAQAELNIADPAKHPYVVASGGRDGLELAGNKLNAVRVYDFYSRQADYYMSLPAAEIPKVLPAFPGLDGGQFGHWGKFNKNDHKDDRWNTMDIGSVVGVPLHAGPLKVEKAVNVNFATLSACFDPETLCFPVVWNSSGDNKFLKFADWRWGMASNSKQGGSSYFRIPEAPQRKDVVYRGYHRSGEAVVFDYDLEGKPTLDRPGEILVAGSLPMFVRELTFEQGTPEARLTICQLPKGAVRDGNVFRHGDSCTLIDTGSMEVELEVMAGGDLFVKLAKSSGSAHLRIALWSGKLTELEKAKAAAAGKILPEMSGKTRWNETVTLAGTRAASDKPYVIDTLPVPLENPYRSVMMFSGMAFFDDGRLAVSTLMGDVWIVSGIDDELKSVTWKRYATGLSIPFGMVVVDGKLLVAGKQQITRLHDTDGNGEADFYENWSNEYLDDHGHPHIYGLGRSDNGDLHIIREYDISRIDQKTRKVEKIAGGVRNCMGFGTGKLGGEFMVLAAPQEGDWTPASMIIRSSQDEFYGFDPKAKNLAHVDLPLCYIPRGVDNSTGGFVFADSDRWGPLGKSLIGLSYGYGSHYAVLYDGSGSFGQAATVPLPGEFIAGPIRGEISPKDGQLYAVGTDGWGNYALQDGCLQRVRYTGKKMVTPIGFQVHSNGLRIDFNEAVEAGTPEDYFVQQWNYEYAKRYGSPEFSISDPKQLGHDRVAVASVRSLNGGKSLFLEMPEMVPAMQMHIRMHLNVGKKDLFPTIVELGDPFKFDGMKELIAGKPRVLKPRIRGKKASAIAKDQSPPDETWAAARRIELKTIESLRFNKTELNAKPGEKLVFTLRNDDVMPHNWVLVYPDSKAKVGKASFNMLNDPEAEAKSYVPTELKKEVIAQTAVVYPKGKQVIYFQAPKKAGDYPFICTFPGHWQIMQGVLKVAE